MAEPRVESPACSHPGSRCRWLHLPTALHATDFAWGKRVMVIDDEEFVLNGMRGILQSWERRVHIALSGAAALARTT